MSKLEEELFYDQMLSSGEHRAHIWNLNSKLGVIRFKIHRVVDHIAARYLLLEFVFDFHSSALKMLC